MTNNIFYVYEHWRLDRDECFYVGKGKGKRAYDYGNRNKHWQAVTAKLTRIGSGYEVKMVATGLSQDEAFSLEIERIAFWKDKVDLTNILPGGLGGPTWSGKKHTEETKKKISEAAKGNKSNTGRKFTEEHRLKLSLSQIGNKKSFGHTDTEETKLKKSLAMKGKKHSLGHKWTEEQRSKNIQARKGQKRTEEQKQKMREGWIKRKQKHVEVE